MKVGYCCINQTLKIGTKLTTLKKYLTLSKQEQIQKLKQLTKTNFENIYKILLWNNEKNIKMFRIGSDVSCLSTHKSCNYKFYEDLEIIEIAKKIKNFCLENNIRLTIHPSQYTVVNSFNENVFENSVKDLEYHYQICNLLGIESINLHIGGVYGNKETAIQNFILNFSRLPKHIQSLIALENDDKSYNVEETLRLCETLNIPMILDFHHARILKSKESIEFYLDRVCKTWKNKKPLSHLSSSANESKLISKHHDFISKEDWDWFLSLVKDNFDVELECKQKDLALLQLGLNL